MYLLPTFTLSFENATQLDLEDFIFTPEAAAAVGYTLDKPIQAHAVTTGLGLNGVKCEVSFHDFPSDLAILLTKTLIDQINGARS